MPNGTTTIPLPESPAVKFSPDDSNRIIRSLWIGELSPLEWLCMESFVRCGHEFHLYRYEPIDQVPSGVTVKDAAQILPPSRVFRNQIGVGKGSFAAFADLFRYQMLHDLGGWWVDMDVFCLKPFTFSAPYVLGAEDKPVANGVIKAPPCCELMRRICHEAMQIDPAQVVWNETGDVVGKAVTELGLLDYVLPAEAFSPLVWHEVPSYVMGKRRFVPSDRSYAVHLYHEMWRRKKLDKWAVHSPHSVVEILKRHCGLKGSPATERPPADWRRWLPWRRAA